jgi:ankyrin repeat protein
MKRRRAFLLSITVVLALCTACGVWLHRERQQYALNRQLIAALMHKDTTTALTLLHSGADPNTHLTPLPSPSLQLLLNHWLNHEPLPVSHEPTAFLFACGAEWWPPSQKPEPRLTMGENLPLIEAMLAHGADVHIRDEHNRTPLRLAIVRERCHTVERLVQRGTNVNEQDADGTTPLMEACNTNTVEGARLLLAHGAQPNIQNNMGRTALFYAVVWPPANGVIPDLLAHGANPDLPDRDKVTPLQMAHKINRPDLVRLLKRGAK